MKILFLLMAIMTFSSFASEAALFCDDKQIDVNTMSFVNSDADLWDEIASDLCSFSSIYERSELCFSGTDNQAYVSVANYFSELSYYDDEIRFIGAYFKTGDQNTIKVVWSSMGYKEEALLHRCKASK